MKGCLCLVGRSGLVGGTERRKVLNSAADVKLLVYVTRKNSSCGLMRDGCSGRKPHRRPRHVGY